MDTVDAALISVMVCLLALIVFVCWLHTCGRWRRETQRRREAFYVQPRRPAMSMLAVQKELGLDRTLLGSLPTHFVCYVVNNKDVNLQECPICLCEFQHMDIGRTLPGCRHEFHAHCVDIWLLENDTCPVCRASCCSTGAAVDPAADHSEVMEQPLAGHDDALQQTLPFYPTNVLFWGDSNHVIMSGISLNNHESHLLLQQQQSTTRTDNVIIDV